MDTEKLELLNRIVWKTPANFFPFPEDDNYVATCRVPPCNAAHIVNKALIINMWCSNKSMSLRRHFGMHRKINNKGSTL